VEGGHPPGDLLDLAANLTLTRCEEAVEAEIGRHPLHDHKVIAGLAVGVQDIRDSEIDIGGQPPIETDLSMARVGAGLSSGEVEKAQVDGLLQLVGTLTY